MARYLALIIKQDKIKLFEPGEEVETDSLKQTLESLNCYVQVLSNLELDPLMQELKKTQQLQSNNYEALLVFIITCGDRHGIWADNKQYQLGQVIDLFTATRSPSFGKKQKLLFVQAPKGVLSIPRADGSEKIPHDGRYLLQADFLVSYATNKSFMMHLQEQLSQHGHDEDIYGLLTRTHKKLADENDPPRIVSFLTDNFRF